MVRKANITDVMGINRAVTHLGYDKQTNEQIETQISIILESDNDELFVYDDGEVKGWVHFFISNRVTSAPFIEIGGLVVSSEFQRLGIGRVLIQHVERYAKDRKMKIRVRCNTQRESAHNFYLSLGFNKLKDQSVFELKK